VAITHPGLIASFGGWVAELFGLDRIVGIFSVYFCGLLLIWWSLVPLIWCVRLLCDLFRWLVAFSLYRVLPQGRIEAVLRTV